MPHVEVPKDLSKIENIFAFGLTGRQCVCLAIGAAIAIPTFLLTRGALGNPLGMLILVAIIIPFGFLALFKHNGQSAEKVLFNFLAHSVFCRKTRRLQREKIYKREVNKNDKNPKI